MLQGREDGKGQGCDEGETESEKSCGTERKGCPSPDRNKEQLDDSVGCDGGLKTGQQAVVSIGDRTPPILPIAENCLRPLTCYDQGEETMELQSR